LSCSSKPTLLTSNPSVKTSNMPKKNADPLLAYRQRIIRELKGVHPLPRKILVAVSGGVDSVVLLQLLFEVRKLFNFELIVGHVHHGLASDPDLAAYRLKTQNFTRKLADQLNLPFRTNSFAPQELKSEAKLRAFRFQIL